MRREWLWTPGFSKLCLPWGLGARWVVRVVQAAQRARDSAWAWERLAAWRAAGPDLACLGPRPATLAADKRPASLQPILRVSGRAKAGRTLRRVSAHPREPLDQPITRSGKTGSWPL